MLQYDPYDTSYVSAPRGIEDDRTVDPDKIPRATRAIIAVSYEARALVIARPCARAREIFFAGPSERTLSPSFSRSKVHPYAASGRGRAACAWEGVHVCATPL